MTYRDPTQYAYKDSDGNFRAGPASDKYTSGQFVPESYANKVRKNARRDRLVRNITRKRPDLSEDEAREQAEEFMRAVDDAKQEFEGDTRAERREREQQLRRIRQKYLYGR